MPFPWFTQCGRVWFTLAMPLQCHPRPYRFSQGHGTARPSKYGLWAFGFFRLSRRVPRNYYQTHSNLRCRWPVWNQTPFVMDEENSGSSTLQKKMISYTVGPAVRIFPATMRTFTKDTALSEQGRGAAWYVWINARHGNGMGTACYVWIGLNSAIINTQLCQDAYLLKSVTSAFVPNQLQFRHDAKEPFHASRKGVVK